LIGIAETFKTNIKELEGILTGFKGRAEHQVPDLVFFNLLVDVLEYTRAVELIAESAVPRAAYASSRACFEAAQDSVLMVSDPNLYDESGALARAFEVADIERLHSRRRRADKALGLPPLPPQPPGRDVLEEDAKSWDLAAPGKGKLLLDGYDQVTSDRRRHWAKLSRKGIADKIAERAGNAPGLAEMSDVLYGLQSFQTHPGPRTGTRDFEQKSENHYTVTTPDAHRETSMRMANGAIEMVLAAEQMRLKIG